MKRLLLGLVILMGISVYGGDTLVIETDGLSKEEVSKLIKQGGKVVEEVKEVGGSLEEVLTPYLSRVLEGLDKGVEFVGEQVPIIVKQFLMFTAFKEGVNFLLGPIIMLLTFIILIKGAPKHTKENLEKFKETDKYQDASSMGYKTVFGRIFYWDYYNGGGRLIISWIGVGVGSLIFLIVGLPSLVEMVKIIFFPNLYLLEEFIHLVK